MMALDQNELKLAGQLSQEWHARIPAGITLQDLLDPTAWKANAGGQVRPGDLIRVQAEDNSFDCRLLVTAVLPRAGLLVRIHGLEMLPGTPFRNMIEQARAEALADERVRLDGAMA